MATLSRRAVNRATLDRQHLLRRVDLTPLAAIEHLVGLQAQTPHTWYVGLWTRLVSCDPYAVGDLLTQRQVVRLALMRSTIHLVTADDALALRPLLHHVGERGLSGNFGKHLVGLDREQLAEAGRKALEARPSTFSQLGRELGQQWPDRDAPSLAQAIRASIALVQVPPRGVWGRRGQALHAPLDSWLGRPLREGYPVDDLIRRYLAAFGPASVKDAQLWSGLTRLREVFDRMRPSLLTFSDEEGAELFDLPDAPRPAPDTPAPARYLYDFDNLLLSHADRSRVVTDSYRTQEFPPDGSVPRIVLVDGFTAGVWTTTIGKDSATLTVRPFGKLSTKDKAALVPEGLSLLAFLTGRTTGHDVAFS